LVDTKTLAIDAPWVAYAKTFSGTDTQKLSVVATNLRTNARNNCKVGGRRLPEKGPSISDMALKRDGSVAWIGTRRVTNPPPSPIYSPPGTPAPPVAPFIPWSYKKQVVACDRTGEQVLDSGVGIGLHSLNLHGSTLSWTAFGETRTARLD
jgi:hypothetical protein